MSTPLSIGFRITSHLQQRLFVLSSPSQSFLASCAILIEGGLDVERLRLACETVAKRHEIFRATFVTLPGSKALYQVTNDSMQLSFAVREAGDLGEFDTTGGIDRLLHEQQLPRPGRDAGPPFRFSLMELSPKRCVLVLSASSLVADSRTLGNIVEEISRFYSGADPGTDHPVQQADYTERQQVLLQADDECARQGKLYWEQQDLASASSPPLPFEEKYLGSGRAQPESIDHDMSRNTFELVEAIAQRYSASASSVLLACWYSLLWRLSGKEDILVHYLSDGRDTLELKSAMGLFAKPLPVRMQFDPDPSFGEVVCRVEERTAAAVQFQTYLSWTDLPGTGNAAPVAFEFEPEFPSITAGEVRFSILRKSVCVQPFKLNLHVDWNKKGATLRFQYGAELARQEVERIARYYDRLLNGLLTNPLARISTVEILDEAELRHLIVELNETQQPYPSDQCIHQLFEAQVERTPDSPAVIFRDQVMSYAEFNAAANRLAHYLRAKGVKRGTRVGLCLNRGADMLIALFGILKAGGAYVPLFAEHPKSRRAHQLAETTSPVLVTQEAYLERLPDFAGEIVCMDRDAALLAAQPQTNPANVSTPNDLVYVMYTSGSTGVPKGVATRHQNVVNYTAFVCRKLGLPNDELRSFALVSYLNADLGKTSIFPPLVSGACVHVIGYDESVDGGLWADYVARNRIDVLKISPSHINALLASAAGRNVLPREYLIVGGEFFTWSMVQRVRNGGNCKIVNHYAPTEVTIGCLMYDVNENDHDAAYAATVPMGRPIANVDAYILDQHRRPVPLGVPGEIYLGGDGLSDGYVNQPVQTAERFVQHPFRSGKLIYRSGDCGRFLPDGNIESLGRTDNQVKIRGFRVELAEIEAALSRHPSVRQAVVIAPEVQPGDRRLSAFVLTSGPGASPDLHTYLRECLPDYMIPGEVRILDTLPLLPNGKTDRQALAELAQTRPESAYAAPRNHVEKVIASLWSEVLDRKEIGVYDNFFELGGHSLIATTVVSRLRTAFDIQLPLRTIFEHSTVAELAEIVQNIQREAVTNEEIARALAEVEKLSEEEVRRLLNEAES